MITTIKTDLTYDGKQAKALVGRSYKDIERFIKTITDASDVEVIEVNSWNEEGNDERYE